MLPKIGKFVFLTRQKNNRNRPALHDA